MRHTMMDIYAHARRVDSVESMFRGIDNPDADAYSILVKAYGKCHRPEEAEQVVRRMIDPPHSVTPNIYIMKCLLDAWTDSAIQYHDAAAQRGYEVFRWFYDDSKFSKLQKQVDVHVYAKVFKCLATSRSSTLKNDIGQKVETVLHEFESRYTGSSSDTGYRQDVIPYNAAITAFLSIHDLNRAEALLERMELSHLSSSESGVMADVRPNVRTYNGFLNYFSKLGTTEGAERAEQFLHRMKKVSRLTDPQTKHMMVSYNNVMNAWAMRENSIAADRMWKLYEEMVHEEKLELDHVSVYILVKVLSQSTAPINIARSLQLLRSISNYKRLQVKSWVYKVILRCCMRLNDNEAAAQVVTLLIEAGASGRCLLDETPDRAKFNWILNKWITADKLTNATIFLETLIPITTKTTARSKLVGLGPDLGTVLDLRKAWTMSSHPEKQHFITKMDTEIIPALMRTLNLPA
jgi:pentatricopeptide repeat protein